MVAPFCGKSNWGAIVGEDVHAGDAEAKRKRRESTNYANERERGEAPYLLIFLSLRALRLCASA